MVTGERIKKIREFAIRCLAIGSVFIPTFILISLFPNYIYVIISATILSVLILGFIALLLFLYVLFIGKGVKA